MYVDESGDTGLCPPGGKSPTRYFCLTGLVVHELRWTETLNELKRFRHWLKWKYKVYLDDELHAADMLMKPKSLPKSLQRLRKYERLAIIRHHADQLARLADIRLINVFVDKAQRKDKDPDSVFRRAWYALFQRFENTILHKNFPGSNGNQERGIVFPDRTDEKQLKLHLEDMRLRNPLFIKQRDGNRTAIDEPIRLLIEDPVCRDSRNSYFIQATDCAVFLFKQHLQPSTYMKEHGAHAYFSTRLRSVLCTHASNQNALGVVQL
jgi:hypothetical protein